MFVTCGSEMFLTGQSLRVKSVHDGGEWPPELTVEHAFLALKVGMTPAISFDEYFT